jgi:hypothetical protein
VINLKVRLTGRTFARLPPEIYSKLIDEKIATVTYKVWMQVNIKR